MSRRAKVIKVHSRFHGVRILVEQGGLPTSFELLAHSSH